MNIYLIHCILPDSRNFVVRNGEIAAEVTTPVACSTQKIKVVNESESEEELTLESIGVRFGFEYSCFIQFFHENMLRNMPFWGLDSSAKVPSAVSLGLEKKIDSGFIIDKISLRHIGEVEGIDVGYGLFAEDVIEEGEMIGEYTGVVMENSTLYSSSFSLNYPCADRGLIVNASEIGNIIRFVNHSSNPNTDFKPFVHEGIVHVICVSTCCCCHNLK